MNEKSIFELRFAATLDQYANRAPTDVDAVSLASLIVRQHPARRFSVGHRTFSRPHWLTPVVLGLLLLAALAAAAFVGAQLLRDNPPGPTPYAEAIVSAGQMTSARQHPIMVTLSDGRVLIAGGGAAEVFDPATASSEAVGGMIPTGDTGSGIALQDGRVFVIVFDGNQTSSRAYLFDPQTAAFQRVEVGGLSNAPTFGVTPGLALLHDGTVLVAGGRADVYKPDMLATAMVFDPARESFAYTGSMTTPRIGHSMTTLADGRVLVVGGASFIPSRVGFNDPVPGDVLSSAELYDPLTGNFSAAADMRTLSGSVLGVQLPDGRVVFFPVPTRQLGPAPIGLYPVEIYNPGTANFSAAGSTTIRAQVAVAMRDGHVLLTGQRPVQVETNQVGVWDTRYVPWASVYDPKTGTERPVAGPRMVDAGAVALHDGRVLFAGGLAYPPPDANGNGSGEAQLVNWIDIFE